MRFFPDGFVPTDPEHRQGYQLLVKIDATGDGVADQGQGLSPEFFFVDGLPLIQ